jgi:hypothetical protein
MPNVFWGGKAPDNSGDWIDSGWGYWTNDKSLIAKIPDGFYDNGWGGLSPIESAPDLDESTVKNLETARSKAKEFGDTAVGKWIDIILTKGKAVLELGKGFGYFRGDIPFTYESLDKTKIRAGQANGETGIYDNINVKAPVPTSNSTYFGIDFSKPLNIVLVILALWAVYKIINMASEPKPATVTQPVQQLSQGYRGRKRMSLAA